MCGRYVQSKSWREYQRYLRAIKIVGAVEDRPSWNVAPSTTSLVIRQDKMDLVVARLRWGIGGASGLIANARMETAAEKAAFREAWRTGRAIVPVDGWYEWRTDENVKQPFYFTPTGGEPVLLAALIRDDGFTLLTSETRGTLRAVHTRRPVAISLERMGDWCDPRRSWSAEELGEALVCEAEYEQIPVGAAVNSSRNDGPHLIERGEVPKAAANQMSFGF